MSTQPERVTIDVTVALDYLRERRERHRHAEALFDLARSGSVDIATAPQGYRLDVDGDLAAQLEEMFAKEDVGAASQLAYPCEATFPSDDLYPGAYVPDFGEAWQDVATNWIPGERGPPGPKDRFHLETHLHEGRDVFITDDGPLLRMCERLREEQGIAIVATGLADYLASRGVT